MDNGTPSLEHLIESEDLGLEVLHPGGLVNHPEFARLCGIVAEAEFWMWPVVLGSARAISRLNSPLR